MPCHHTLEVRDTLRHWRSSTSTMVSVQCPAGPLIFPKNLNVPKSTPSASDDVHIRQLIETVDQNAGQTDMMSFLDMCFMVSDADSLDVSRVRLQKFVCHFERRVQWRRTQLQQLRI